MRTRVTIGDFSRASQLSVKTLRHYHDVGLLEPSEVDPGNGYRYYSQDQIPVAQVIRRLRDLQMPVADVKSVLLGGIGETHRASGGGGFQTGRNSTTPRSARAYPTTRH